MANRSGDAETENPGALAGATGTDIETSEFRGEGYRNSATPTSRPVPRDDWNRERWAWLAGVNAAPNLTPIAKCVASVIVTQAADHISADCLWKNERFAVALAVSVDTIKRAFRALADAGWLIRQDGRGRGNAAGMTFTTPRASGGCASTEKGGNPAHKADTVGRNPARTQPGKGGNPAPLSRGGRKRKRVQNCTEKGAELHFPPTPPYKDTPNNLQRARATDAPEKPRLNTPAVAHHGSDRERAWNSYLTARNWPCLADLGIKSSDADGIGWEVPFRQPPGSHDRIPTMIVARWVEWAISKMENRHAAA